MIMHVDVIVLSTKVIRFSGRLIRMKDTVTM